MLKRWKCIMRVNNLVDKCYKHGRGELLNIPNSGLIPSQISISNVTSRPLLSKPRSSKQPNAPECSVVSKLLLKRGVSGKVSKNHDEKPLYLRERRSFVGGIYYSVTESDDDDGKEGSDYELEADLHDMIEKLYLNLCGSGISVAPIKAGFAARVGRRKAGT
ncbi:hypothetical protein KY289_028607 [Solanum tuberosum]|nr:hypothetical protein KY289_028607 [Solanum tuberosum]